MGADSRKIRQSSRCVDEAENQSDRLLSSSLGFEGDLSLLDDKIHLHRFADRQGVVKEGEHVNKLYFIIRGSIVNYMREISGAKRERQ